MLIKNWQKGMGPNVLAYFSFICSSITSKRDVMVLWHKIVQSIKSFMTSSLSRVYYVIKQCSVLFDVEIRVLLFLAHLTEILYMGQFYFADLKFEPKDPR